MVEEAFLPPADCTEALYAGLPQLEWCSGSALAGELDEPRVRPRLAPHGSLGHAVYTLPSFASAMECDALLAEAGRLMECYSPPVNEMPGRARLSLNDFKLKDVLLRRLLALVEESMPALAMMQFGQTKGLQLLPIHFSSGEPAVNVYTPAQRGGGFKPHTDNLDLTILIPLSPPGAFEGGGTAFWAGDHIADCATCKQRDCQCPPAYPPVDDEDDERTLPHDYVLRPPAGTALVFSGDITHAGLPVSAGTRRMFVMSFGLRPKGLTPCDRDVFRVAEDGPLDRGVMNSFANG